MKKLLRRWLDIDEILTNQRRISLLCEEIIKFNSQIQEKLDDINSINFIEKLDKVEFNAERLNQMLLELKGVVAMSRAALQDKKNQHM